jgi:hypothetical protein
MWALAGTGGPSCKADTVSVSLFCPLIVVAFAETKQANDMLSFAAREHGC